MSSSSGPGCQPKRFQGVNQALGGPSPWFWRMRAGPRSRGKETFWPIRTRACQRSEVQSVRESRVLLCGDSAVTRRVFSSSQTNRPGQWDAAEGRHAQGQCQRLAEILKATKPSRDPPLSLFSPLSVSTMWCCRCVCACSSSSRAAAPSVKPRGASAGSTAAL